MSIYSYLHMFISQYFHIKIFPYVNISKYTYFHISIFQYLSFLVSPLSLKPPQDIVSQLIATSPPFLSFLFLELFVLIVEASVLTDVSHVPETGSFSPLLRPLCSLDQSLGPRSPIYFQVRDSEWLESLVYLLWQSHPALPGVLTDWGPAGKMGEEWWWSWMETGVCQVVMEEGGSLGSACWRWNQALWREGKEERAAVKIGHNFGGKAAGDTQVCTDQAQHTSCVDGI